MRYLGIASLLTCVPALLGVSTISAARADQTLNVQLPPIHAKTASTAAPDAAPDQSKDAKAFAEYVRKHAKTASKTRGYALSSRGSQGIPHANHAAKKPNEKVVGRLGVVAHGATIHASRSSRRALAKVAAGTYLALTGDQGDWYGVLMSDHSVGWVRKDDVNILDYEVVGPAGQPASHASRFTGGDPLVTGMAKAVLDEAFQYLGVPYKYGGNSLTSGIDCSAFVKHCFATVGVGLPRTAAEQSECGQAIAPEDLQAGDRLYFAGRDGRISHTGIYIGNGNFIHASSKNHGVSVSNLSEPLYRQMYVGARR